MTIQTPFFNTPEINILPGFFIVPASPTFTPSGNQGHIFAEHNGEDCLIPLHLNLTWEESQKQLLASLNAKAGLALESFVTAVLNDHAAAGVVVNGVEFYEFTPPVIKTIDYDKRLETILGVSKEVALPLLEQEQGISFQSVAEASFAMRWDLISRTRKRMEADLDSLHFIPYILVRIGGNSFLVYQRPEQNNGESRLAGNHSVCFGGHVDICDYVYGDKGQLDLYATLIKSAWRELHEELKFRLRWGNVDLDLDLRKEPDMATLRPVGFIMDSSNSVGLTHLGVLMVLDIDGSLDASSGENQILGLEETNLDSVLCGEYKFENWSNMVIEQMVEGKV